MSLLKNILRNIHYIFIGIFRNKRRAFAMLSGILLGTLIISGIFIYVDVLNQQNFESVVESAIYEVQFDIVEDETIDKLNEIGDLFEEDTRVLGTTVITQPSTEGMSTSIIMNRDKSSNDTNVGQTIGGISGQILPVFVNENFEQSVIGQELLSESVFQGNFDLSGNSSVIPREIASRYRLQVGDTLDELNITITAFGNQQGGPPGSPNTEQKKGSLSNVVISGIYEKEEGDAGFFGNFFNPHEIFLSYDLLNNHLPELQQLFAEEDTSFLATKIDVSKFTISEPETMNEEILQMMNHLSEEASNTLGYEVTGSNQIQNLLVPFQITSIFVLIFQLLIALPVVILSLYLLVYGIQLSLEERKREIGIKKVQGAESSQIFSELFNETILIFIVGILGGYGAGIFSAWLISTATGFLIFNFEQALDFTEFFRFDVWAIGLSLFVIGIVLIYLIRTRGKSFIESEVSEQIKRFEESEEGFFKRNNIDFILFGIGVISGIISIIEQGFGYSIDLGTLLGLIIYSLGPFFLWIGGSMVGVRIANWLPLKLEQPLFSTRIFKDIKRIIKSGLRRRGDTRRLALIIILTLSIATLSASQGVTDAAHTDRTTKFQVGADYQVNFQVPGDFQSNLEQPDVVNNALGIGTSKTLRILSTYYTMSGFNIEAELDRLKNDQNVAIWQSDMFVDMTPEEALSKLQNNKQGIFLDTLSQQQLDVSEGETVDLKLNKPINQTHSETFTMRNIEILGLYDHLPGGISGGRIFSSDLMVNQIRAINNGLAMSAYDNQPMNASTYLVDISKDKLSQAEENELLSEWSQLPEYSETISLQQQLDAQNSGNFGIPGLLTMNFFISVIGAFISTFVFSAILMERRKQEFAVLRAVGSSKKQIYKIAVAENLILVTSTVIWGSIIGVGLTYQFNGLFAFFNMFLGAGPLNRLVIFPWQLILLIGLGTTLGMILATVLSVRSAANQDLSVATRTV